MSGLLESRVFPSQVSFDPNSRRPSAHAAALLGIGTAVPQYAATQQESCAFMERVLSTSAAGTDMLPLLRRIYRGSGVQRRQSVLQDYIRTSPDEYTFFPKSADLEPFPSTSARMECFERTSVRLAADAARAAMQNAGLDARKITHLVISTCTGFFAPGPDVLLVKELGLDPTVTRTILGFMGCYAGVSGMRVADDIIRAHPDAVVLQVAVELCSLHYQKDPTPDTFVANALFSDGAAAAVYGNSGSREGRRAPLAKVSAAHSMVCEDTTDRMSWRIGDTGFRMRLDAEVPALLRGAAAEFVEQMAAKADIVPGQIDGWAIHPGGPRILTAVSESLELPASAMEASTSVLRDYGNMSSSTILFVLDRLLNRSDSAAVETRYVAVLAFGPGLTIEGALLQV